MKAAVSTPTISAVATPELCPPETATEEGVLLRRLEDICAARGLVGLASRIHQLIDFVSQDMVTFEAEFAELPELESVYPMDSLARRGGLHLLDHGGKRLRPICVALASRLGNGFSPQALDLAVAAELVHSATLLHDDVVDLSDTRRGSPTARLVYGNAASIFAGDWLLIEALRRVQRTRIPELMPHLLDAIDEMIAAESLQLQNRGRIETEREAYFRVIEGKTAAIFRWAMVAGGTAGGLSPEQLQALAEYGRHLGIAFQATDDLLDLTGDVGRTGKELFTDLREGKMTFPLIVALEREPELRVLIEDLLALDPEGPLPPAAAAEVVAALRRTRAVEDCQRLARHHSNAAVESLEPLADTQARRALVTVAEAIVDRDL